ncbi:solute carrier family 15 member 2-like [Montipora foliosa]|uniref:solute carrier family 15 member 2-like n=1 Tax=Montipora foliosa TaxID=591990 RepID=UPI0035F20076
MSFAMSDQNSSSPVNRRGSQQSWTGSEIFRCPLPNNDAVESPVNTTVITKISGKFWGRVRKFLLCKNNFPSSIYYIVGNEFCERFSYYGMKAILILYLTRMLDFTDNKATAIFHSFSMLCYFTPLFGAMLADGWLGKYRTILYVSMVYCTGNLIVSITSIPPIGHNKAVGPIIGLFLIALGTGGIKPCVSAFGGDQFTADQTHLLQSFFSVFYFAINAGSLISMLVTPALRGDVTCFQDDCYPLAFGVPALLMILAIALFWLGRHKYKRVPQTGNIVWQVMKAITHALKRKITTKGEKKAHWLDWAGDDYDPQLIQDIKALCKVLLMFVPLPVFWTLFDQQGSRWVLQAGQMDGDAGLLGTIKPDQMQALNALFIILLIPLFEVVVYPLLKRPKPLKRMCVGMFLASVAFVFAGFLQMKIQSEEVIKNAPPSGHVNVQVINALDCPASITVANKSVTVHSNEKSAEQHLSATSNTSLRITPLSANCYNTSGKTFENSLYLEEKQWYNLVVYSIGNRVFENTVKQDVIPPPPGKSKLCTVILPLSADYKAFDVFLNNDRKQENVEALGQPKCTIISSDHYSLKVQGRSSSKVYVSSDVVVRNGGVYTALVQKRNDVNMDSAKVTLYEDLPARNVSMFYQIPQYFVITSGEILFSITGLEFAYSQAPANMKSCLQAAWLMTVAFGNLIVVIEAESHIFTNQTTEFFFFAAMLFVVMLVFMVMSIFYQYVDLPVVEPAAPVAVDSSNDKTAIVQMDELAQI